MAAKWGVTAEEIRAAINPPAPPPPALVPGLNSWTGWEEWLAVTTDAPPSALTGASYATSDPGGVMTLVFRKTLDPWGDVSPLARALIYLVRCALGASRVSFGTQVVLPDPLPVGDDLPPEEFIGPPAGTPLPEFDPTAYITARGWTLYERLPHEECPIDPGPSKRDPVVVLEQSLYCHHCQQGRSFASLAGFTETAEDRLRRAALALVHWHHAKHLVRKLWPLPVDRWGSIDLLQIFWGAFVRAVHAKNPDPVMNLVPRVMDPALIVLRSYIGNWLHAETFQPVDMDRRALSTLPLTRGHPATVAIALGTHAIDGVEPVKVMPFGLDEDPDELLIETRPDLRPKAWVSQQDVRDALAREYPGYNENNLVALLAAGICARRMVMPVILASVGPTGSGKTTTPDIAAAVLGGRVASLSHEICQGRADAVARALGSSAAIPTTTCITIDEVDKIQSPTNTFVRPLLTIRRDITYRPLFSTGQVSVRLICPIVLTSISAPEFYASPEVARRLTMLRYKARVDWHKSPAEWVDENPELSASLLFYVLEWARSLGFDWSAIQKALGLESAAQEFVRFPPATMTLVWTALQGPASTEGRFGGWVDLTLTASSLVTELLPDVPMGVNPYILLARDLNATDWRGFGEPQFKAYKGRLYGRIVA